MHVYIGCGLDSYCSIYYVFFQIAMFAKIKHKAKDIKDNYIVNPWQMWPVVLYKEEGNQAWRSKFSVNFPSSQGGLIVIFYQNMFILWIIYNRRYVRRV